MALRLGRGLLSSFLPPKGCWVAHGQVAAKKGFVAEPLRTSRSKKRLAEREAQREAAGTRAVRPGAPPIKKTRKKHRHATDLEDLGHSVPAKEVRQLHQRPMAALPRTPQFFVRFGPPMSVEDLAHDAPSVFVESRRLLDDVLERREKLQARPDYVAPDTPFWRVPPKLRAKKPVKWELKEGPKATANEAAEQLKGIVDLGRPPGGRKAQPLSPAKATSKLLQEDGKVEAEAVGKAQPLDLKGAVDHSFEHGIASVSPRRGPEQSLIASLRQKAEDYARTGVDPDLLESMSEALQDFPGAERAARLREMRSSEAHFEGLVLEGKASVANYNELIRALGLQGKMAEALQTHDAMRLHGYEPDAETFVSLLLGAGAAWGCGAGPEGLPEDERAAHQCHA